MSTESRTRAASRTLALSRSRFLGAKQLARIMLYAGLTLGAAAMLLPFAWMVATSLEPESDIFRYPTALLPGT